MDDPSFEVEIDTNTQEILLHAANHDLASLKPFLRIPGNASVQDPETGFTPLHAAIAACEPEEKNESNESTATKEQEANIEQAKAVVKELFLSGAIWNDLDSNNETPGCLAWRIGRKELYELCVEAGVRAEMLLGLMGRYEALDSGSDEEEEEAVDMDGITGATTNTEMNGQYENKDVNSEDYLTSELKFEDGKLLDEDNNGVMMAWETSIMERSVEALLPPDEDTGKRILNIGFGMGIVDGLFAKTKPSVHHIIEAHPAVLAKLQEPNHDFGPKWESSGPTQGAYKIYAGKWQDVLPSLLESGYTYDAIYFDTFGEDYSALKNFFSEFVPGLLNDGGAFGFFNGLGADRRVCYDVYTRVVELDLRDAGLEVEWEDVLVGPLGGEGEGEWYGVRRRYWVLEGYRLPTCRFLC
jgi:protein arginine N-methyltransferase 2